MNYENIVPQIIEFERKVIKGKNDAIIIGDELALYIFVSLFLSLCINDSVSSTQLFILGKSMSKLGL